MRYAAIDTTRPQYPLQMLCDELSVSKSGYNEWKTRPPSKRTCANVSLVSEIWLADINYVATDEGFLYVAAMKDLCTKKIVGWSMSATIDAQLALDALTMAMSRQKLAAGLVVHSDRGQYASGVFRQKLRELQMPQSMSRRGKCYDNAPMENFFASLKTERLEQEHFATRDAARAATLEYVATFYNPVRLHSSIGYRAPNQFEAMMNAGG